MLISKRGREWMKLAVHEAKTQAGGWFVVGDCEIRVRVFVPDNRRRDIDNLLKPVQDCVTHAGLWKDDCQVKSLHVTHCGVDKGNPRCEVSIMAL
jgi:crossover junction endodeoxyribonuclease RusA